MESAAKGTPRNHDVAIDDYFTIASVTHVALSPDGKLAAYAEARWQESSNDRKTDLWVVPLDRSGAWLDLLDRIAYAAARASG